MLIGRSNEGNDHLTLHLARPEDYWFHVHGTPGSHVVLRRGKGTVGARGQRDGQIADFENRPLVSHRTPLPSAFRSRPRSPV